MKKIILFAIALTGISLAGKAQCGSTKLQFKSSKTEFLDSGKQLVDSHDENVTVEFTKTTVTVTLEDNPDGSLSGPVESNECSWKDAFKNGRSIIKSTLSDAHGDPKTATITIEAIDGKITILFEAKEFPDKKLRLVVDKYEETK